MDRFIRVKEVEEDIFTVEEADIRVTQGVRRLSSTRTLKIGPTQHSLGYTKRKMFKKSKEILAS